MPNTSSKDASVLGGRGVNENTETQNDNDNNGDARMGMVEREFGMKLSVLLKKRSQAWSSTHYSASSLNPGRGKIRKRLQLSWKRDDWIREGPGRRRGTIRATHLSKRGPRRRSPTAGYGEARRTSALLATSNSYVGCPVTQEARVQ